MKIPVAVLGLSIVCVGLGAATPKQAIPGCRRAPAQHLLWVHSGDWVGQRLVLGDVGDGALAVLELPGLTWSRISYPGEGPLEFNKPIVIPHDDSVPLVAAKSRIVRLDAALRPVKSYPLRAAVEGALEVGLYGGHVALEDRVMGLFFVQDGEGNFQEAISVLTLEPKLRLETVRRVSPESNEFRSALLSLDLSAVLGGRFYWLGMETEAFVLQIDGGKSEPLDLVPPAWRRVPTFPAGGPSMVRADNAALEKLAFPAGLHSQGKELFILYHDPKKSGTHWSLAAVDPEKPGAHRLLTLPTRSNWITVIPGPQYWAILEQGPVLGPAMQTTSSVLLVPSAWFSALDSPLTGLKGEKACAEMP